MMVFFGLVGLAKADILNPIGPGSEKVSFATPTAFDSGTLLTDAASVINYLGVREGEVYNFMSHSWVTTTGATIVTYAPWNLSLGISMLNTDGVAGTIDWNVGSYLPVASIPVMKYIQYLYVVGGCGGEMNSNNNWKVAPILGAEFKFNF